MAIFHTRQDDQGNPVILKHPHQASAMSAWNDAGQMATAVPGKAMPASLGGIDLLPWHDFPKTPRAWNEFADDEGFSEPEFVVAKGKEAASGAIVVEPDGRVWMVSPSNGFGGFENVFPKGKQESSLMTLRANAIKEVLEETGLRIELTGFLCDSERSTTTTRFYLARRTGGCPSEMGWESQAVHLVPSGKLFDMVSHPGDRTVLSALKTLLTLA